MVLGYKLIKNKDETYSYGDQVDDIENADILVCEVDELDELDLENNLIIMKYHTPYKLRPEHLSKKANNRELMQVVKFYDEVTYTVLDIIYHLQIDSLTTIRKIFINSEEIFIQYQHVYISTARPYKKISIVTKYYKNWYSIILYVDTHSNKVDFVGVRCEPVIIT